MLTQEHEQLYKKDIHFCVTQTKKADVRLWADIFGDSVSDIKAALSSFDGTGACISLKSGELTISQFIGIEAAICGERGIYIYALCTHLQMRGRGYMRILLDLAKKHFSLCGYKFFLLLPASEALAQSYRRLGFSVSLPAYATPSPECERDFFFACDGMFSQYEEKDFDGDVKKLYELSSKVFSCDVFEYCLSALSGITKIKCFADTDGEDGFLVYCGDRIFLSSRKHACLIKSQPPQSSALLMPFEDCLRDFSCCNPEPMPR